MKTSIWTWFPRSSRKKVGIILIAFGIGLIIFSLPFSSGYDSKDSFILNIIRGIFTGGIIVRESVVESVPDRDEKLYKEFNEFKLKHPEFTNLPEGEIMDKFYDENYRDKMYRMEFRLKLEKQKIVARKSKIAVPYKYIFASGIFLLFAGTGIMASSIRRSRKK